MIHNRSVSRIGALAGFLTGALCLVVALGCNDSSSAVSSAGLPNGPATLEQVKGGRDLVINSSCADCHNGGKTDPSDPNWLSGFHAGGGGSFDIGPFKTYAKNLTPDPTGIKDDTPRQLFNALRFGLAPDVDTDKEITSTTPGVGNFPATPHYLAVPMPWPAFRHMTDDQLWAIIAYLKHGLKPVSNTVPPSAGPPDFWASSYMDAVVGPAVIPSFPAASEQLAP